MEEAKTTKEGPPKGTGMRIIGQVTGHEITLERKDVLVKKNL